MKKLVLLFGILCMLFLTCGCVKSEYSIDLSNPKDIAVTISVGFNTNFLNMMGMTSEDMFSNKETNYESEGYTVKTFTDAKYTGISATKKYKDLNELNTDPLPAGFTSGVGELVSVKNGFLNKTYTIDLTYDLKKANKDNMGSNQNNSSQYSDEQMEAFFNQYPDYRPESNLTIKLPTKAKENNADKVSEEGNVYTWNLAKSTKEPVKINLVYNQLQVLNLIILIVGIGLILGIAVKLTSK